MVPQEKVDHRPGCGPGKWKKKAADNLAGGKGGGRGQGISCERGCNLEQEDAKQGKGSDSLTFFNKGDTKTI